MKRRSAFLALFLLSGSLLLMPAASPANPSGFATEVPGVAGAVTNVAVEGGDGVLGVAYRTSGGNGFALRSVAGSWSIQTGDVSGNGTLMADPDLCYLGGGSWAWAAKASNQVWVYRSDDDGATWTHKFTVANSTWRGGLDCADDAPNTWGLVEAPESPANTARFWRSIDGGATWWGGFSISDDDGAPDQVGTETVPGISGATLQTTDVVWYPDGSKVTAIFNWQTSNGGGYYSTWSDDAGIFWSTPSSEGSDGTCCGGYARAGLAGSDGRYWTINNIKAHGETDILISFGTWSNLGSVSTNGQYWGSPDNPGSQTNAAIYCGSPRCQIDANREGQMVYASDTGGTIKLRFAEADATLASDDVVATSVGSNAGLSNEYAVHIDDQYAVLAYADGGQGDRLEVRIGNVALSGGGGSSGADVETPVTAGVGLAVDPAGQRVSTREDSGATVTYRRGGDLVATTTQATPNCGRSNGVDAMSFYFAFVDCDGSNNAETIRIRDALGQETRPDNCPASTCPTNIGVEASGDWDQLSHINGFSFSYDYWAAGASVKDYSVIGFSYATYDDRVGIFLKATRGDLQNDILRVAGTSALGSGGAVDDICSWVHNNNYHIALADLEVGLLRFDFDLTIETEQGLFRLFELLGASVDSVAVEVKDIGVVQTNVHGYGTGIGPARAVACHGDTVVAATDDGRIVRMDAFSGAVEWVKTGVSEYAQGVALDGSGTKTAYADGSDLVVVDYDGTELSRRALPAGAFKALGIDNLGTNVWVLTSDILARYDIADAESFLGPPVSCVGLNETECPGFLDGTNPMCLRDTDGDGIVDCFDPDICNDGTPDTEDTDDDCDGIPDWLDPDHPDNGDPPPSLFPPPGGDGDDGGGGGALGDPSFPGVDFDTLDGVGGMAAVSWAWLIGFVLVLMGLGIGIAFGSGHGALAVGIGGGSGALFGLVLAVGMSLWPVWTVVVLVFLAAAALFLRRRF